MPSRFSTVSNGFFDFLHMLPLPDPVADEDSSESTFLLHQRSPALRNCILPRSLVSCLAQRVSDQATWLVTELLGAMYGPV